MNRTRKIVRIDESKCNGCGQCAEACAEGALRIIGGKARLVSETYCDGLGACLGKCPQDAITVEERPAAEFDEKAVERRLAEQKPACGCPGTAAHSFAAHTVCPGTAVRSFARGQDARATEVEDAPPSQLGQWPVQMRLVPPSAPFLRGADLVICADCVPFAVADFHRRYLAGRAVLVGCPKLDDIGYYRETLASIFAEARPASITVLRMEVPCCAALAHAVIEARDEAAPSVPVEVHVVGIRAGIRIQKAESEKTDERESGKGGKGEKEHAGREAQP